MNCRKCNRKIPWTGAFFSFICESCSEKEKKEKNAKKFLREKSISIRDEDIVSIEVSQTSLSGKIPKKYLEWGTNLVIKGKAKVQDTEEEILIGKYLIDKVIEYDFDEEELREFIEENKVELKGKGWGWYVQSIFEHFCEKDLIQPTFVIDHPRETTPLCKIHRKDERLIERFESFCMGTELSNAYSELNDPIEQRKLLEDQQKELTSGNNEANPYDEDFVNAIEIGMPPTSGIGIGIDRMIILLTGQESIRDVIMFPFMKPETKTEAKVEVNEVKQEKKDNKKESKKEAKKK